jgi:hypothetical protein
MSRKPTLRFIPFDDVCAPLQDKTAVRIDLSRADAQDIAAEIIRRAAGNDDNSMTAYVLRLARPLPSRSDCS